MIATNWRVHLDSFNKHLENVDVVCLSLFLENNTCLIPHMHMQI